MDKKSLYGYRTDSPYRNAPYLDINSPQGLIDMSSTDIPLYAVDETGYTKILMPYSGLHKFRGKRVREIPISQYGGYSAQDFYDFLFEGDDTEVKQEETVTAPTEQDISAQGFDPNAARRQQQDMAAMDAASYTYGNYGLDESSMLTSNSNPTRRGEFRVNAPQFTLSNNNPYKAGQYGQEIIGEVTSALGYTPQFNSVQRSAEKQQQLINQGVGVKNSWHLTGDAVDMKPADWNKLPAEKKQYFKSKYDVIYHNNHYHMEPKGSRKKQGGYPVNPYKYF